MFGSKHYFSFFAASLLTHLVCIGKTLLLVAFETQVLF